MADLAEEAVPETGVPEKTRQEKTRQEKTRQEKARQEKTTSEKGTLEKAGARRGLRQALKKRWRAWLRAVHRDVGYLAVGFTLIYALSGIAMNHLEDWDPNFRASEAQLKIAPIPDDLSDDEAVARVAAAAGLSGKPSDVLRAGDEVRLEYPSGSKVTAIGDTVTVQRRESRFFFRVANWLHATRGKAAWKYIADAYAALLLYLAISGLFMIKGKLGLRWRGTLLMGVGLAVPLAYIVLAGGPEAQKTEQATDAATARAAASAPDEDGIRPLPPDPEVAGEAAGEAAGAPAGDPGDPGDSAPRRPPVLKQPPPGS